MNDWLMVMLIVLAVALAMIGWYFYDLHIGRPRDRRKKLETSLDALAAHNVEVAHIGSSSRIEQTKHLKSRDSPISVIDLLNRDSKLNQDGDWKKLTFHEGFHQGPYADELTDDEWQFVHQRYAQLVEQKTSHRVRVETHQRLLKESENRVDKLTKTYVEQAKAIAEQTGDHDSNRWNDEFDALNRGKDQRPQS
ncbi:MAG: hypothetical protein ACTMHH_03070 [Nesterenkonia sp.]